MSRRLRVDLVCGVALLLAACATATTGRPGGGPSPEPTRAPTRPDAHTLVVSGPLPTLPPAPSSAPEPTRPPTLTATPATPPVVSLMAVGDIMLARTIGARLQAEGPQTVFAGVSEVLMNADVLVGNLECTLSSLGQPEPKSYAFAAPSEAVYSLASAGFDVVSQANNHALDYGPAALAETRQRLEAEGIRVVGAGPDETTAHAPVIVERNSLRIAFLAYVDVPVEGGGFDTRRWIAMGDQPGVAWADPARIQTDVAVAKMAADVVVVLMHFGWESRTEPAAEQAGAARAAVDGGAALVIGAHPHVLQKAEWYNGGLIVYSLGNFVFDGFGPPANYTAILSVTLTRGGAAGVQWIPAVVQGGLPRLATADEAALILPMVSQ